MKRKIIPVLIGCTLSFSALAAQPTAERYVVSFPEGTHVNYAGAFASAFPNGLPVGIGSGLLFTGKQGDALTFATITDRGPNADSPKEGKNETKIFVTPDFAPLLMTIRVQNGKAEAIDPRPLHDDKGAINGLPLASDVIGSTNEVAFSDTLHRLKGDTAHITETDNAWLYSLSHQTSDFGESEWIHFTGTGYLLRTDAWSYPVLRLKRLGLSKTFRRLVVTLIRRYGVSLIHLDASAGYLPGLPTFDW